MNLTIAITRLKRILQSQDINFDSESETLQDCVREAVDKYSEDMPISLLIDLAGNGTQVLDFPVTFTYDFSVIKRVEYPVDDTVSDKVYLDTDDYSFYRKPDGTLQLLMLEGTPEDASDPVRVEFTKYVDTISDVLAHHEKGVLQLSAYFAALREAMKAANTTSDGEGLDFVEHTTSSSRYESLAEKFKKNYENSIFGDADAAENAGKTVASAHMDQWTTESRFNEPRIFHKDDT